VAPGQFVAVVAVTQLSENFQHANLRCWFGRVGERLWSARAFTAATMPSASGMRPGRSGRPVLGAATGVLLPWWDMLFGTANFELRYEPTGVRDQVEPGPRACDYGRALAQRWLAQRLSARLSRPCWRWGLPGALPGGQAALCCRHDAAA
jgi:hypothetical protein